MMFEVILPADQSWMTRQRLEWCEQQFGPMGWLLDPGARCHRFGDILCFRDEQDLTLYLLRWS